MAELEPKMGSPRSQSLSFDRNCCPPLHRAAGSRAVGDVHRLALHLISLVLFFFLSLFPPSPLLLMLPSALQITFSFLLIF